MQGKVVRIVGQNGSGKTCMLRHLAGLPTHAPVSATPLGREQVQFVAQEAKDTLVGLTVGGEFTFRGREPPPGLPLGRDVATLSSGEARRIALALCNAPGVLLLDEPDEGLDAEGVGMLRRLIAERRDQGVVVVDHHGLFADLADETIRLGSSNEAQLPAVPAPEGEVIMRSEAMTVRGIDIPAVRLGPGIHVLTGPNGCGKSTLLRRLAGLDGSGATVRGSPVETGRNVRLLLPRARDHLQADRVAELVDAGPLVPHRLLDRHPITLSGGEAQRVALALTLGRDAPVYLLDEPEAHLDAAGLEALWQIMADRCNHACILMATHDERLIRAAHSRLEWP